MGMHECRAHSQIMVVKGSTVTGKKCKGVVAAEYNTPWSTKKKELRLDFNWNERAY